MGRASVRAAIATYFAPSPSTPFLASVYRSRPSLIAETAYDQGQASGGSGAVLIVHLVDDTEESRALVGSAHAQNTDVHRVVLEVKFKSVKQSPANPADDVMVSAQDDHDALLDGLKALIRADKTLGCGYNPTTNEPNGPIWQAGAVPPNERVLVRMTEPVTSNDGLTFECNTTISFDAWEWIVL